MKRCNLRMQAQMLVAQAQMQRCSMQQNAYRDAEISSARRLTKMYVRNCTLQDATNCLRAANATIAALTAHICAACAPR